jgi:hypothetical protein
MRLRACRYLDLQYNQINGSFPSVVSGLSSLTCVQCVLCVFARAWAVYSGHVQSTVCTRLCVCVRCVCGCCVSGCVGAWCVSCVAVTSVQWMCGPWWVASAVVAVVSARGRNISMRGSAVSTPAVVMHVRACRWLHLSSNQISGSFPSVVSGLSSLTCVGCVLCVFASAWAVCGVHVQSTGCICLCACVRAWPGICQWAATRDCRAWTPQRALLVLSSCQKLGAFSALQVDSGAVYSSLQLPALGGALPGTRAPLGPPTPRL